MNIPRPVRRRTRSTVVLVAALLALTGCAAGASGEPSAEPDAGSNELTQVDVAFGFLSNVEYAGNFVADDAGLYADEGLDVTFISGGPNAPAPEVAIASGQAQIAFESNTSRLFNYLAENDDIVIIGQAFQRTPNGLLSLEKHPVRDAEELQGARVIAGAPNKSSIDALMAINDVTDYTFVPGGADIGALQAGQGDALLGFATNQAIVMEQQGLTEGKDFYFVPFDEFDYHLMADVIIVSRAFLDEHRDAVVGFLRATAAGWEQAFADPDAAAELTVNTYAAEQGLNLDQQKASLKAQIPYMTSELTDTSGLLAVDPNAVQEKVYPSLTEAGLTSLPDVSTVFDLSVLEDAHAK